VATANGIRLGVHLVAMAARCATWGQSRAAAAGRKAVSHLLLEIRALLHGWTGRNKARLVLTP